MTIKPIDPFQAKTLIDELDVYQRQLYPDESCHLDSIETLQNENVIFLAAIDNQEISAIGAVKLFENYGELKRIYVPPQHRGKQLAQKIIAELEKELILKQVFVAKLETGPPSVEAIKLYTKLGYQECEKFGDYKDDPLSIFMEKIL